MGAIKIILVCCGAVFAGAVIGGLSGGNLFSSPADMGWDRLANMVGGMMVGGLVGLGVAVTMLYSKSRKKKTN